MFAAFILRHSTLLLNCPQKVCKKNLLHLLVLYLYLVIFNFWILAESFAFFEKESIIDCWRFFKVALTSFSDNSNIWLILVLVLAVCLFSFKLRFLASWNYGCFLILCCTFCYYVQKLRILLKSLYVSRYSSSFDLAYRYWSTFVVFSSNGSLIFRDFTVVWSAQFI